MMPMLVWLIAIASSAICLFLWFRDVNRVMKERKSTVDSAFAQLTIHRKNAAKAWCDPDAAAVLDRSEQIYRQAVDLYHSTLKKPTVWLPATFMGYRPISEKPPF